MKGVRIIITEGLLAELFKIDAERLILFTVKDWPKTTNCEDTTNSIFDYPMKFHGNGSPSSASFNGVNKARMKIIKANIISKVGSFSSFTKQEIFIFCHMYIKEKLNLPFIIMTLRSGVDQNL